MTVFFSFNIIHVILKDLVERISKIIFNGNFCFSFTAILGDKRFQETAGPPAPRKSRRLSSPSSERKLELYPDECQLCGKQRTQHKNKKCTPYIITSVAAVEAIKNAAKLKDNMHYCEIKDVDLISKEYKVHQHCYKNFTKGFSVKEKSQNKMDIETQPSESEPTAAYSQSNYEEVKEYVKNMVINVLHL